MAITVKEGTTAYGASWAKTSSPACTRLASAVGKTGGENFDSIAPWMFKRCNLWHDDIDSTYEVTAYHGENCYTDIYIEDMGPVMVEIPKFYYYTFYDSGSTTYYWFVSPDADCEVDLGLGAGSQPFKTHPAFQRGGSTLYDGTTKSVLYLGAYEAYVNGMSLESKAGVRPTCGLTRDAYRQAAHFRFGIWRPANHWEIQDYLITSAIQLLALIEFATFETQTAQPNGLGLGVTGLAAETNRVLPVRTGWTGSCDNNDGSTSAYDYGNLTGQKSFATNTEDGLAAGDSTHTAYAMSYRGIENIFGNTWTILDGLNIAANKPWIANHSFAEQTYGAYAHPYIDTTLTLNTGSNLTADITDIAYDATYHDFGFLPNTGSGTNYGIYLCDKANVQNTATTRSPYYGGHWGLSYEAGLFHLSPWYAYDYVGVTALKAGTRLMYIP